MSSAADTLQDSAERLLESGRWAESAEAYRRLLTLQPDRPDAWYNLGFVLHRLARYDEALQAYQGALDLGIDAAEEVHLNRAVILAEGLVRPDEAAGALHAALGCNPHHVPSWINLGTLHERLGQRAQAREAYERALALAPEHPVALSRLPDVSAASAASDLPTRLRAALARPGLVAEARADLGFGLGKVLDAAGQYDAAFNAYRDANAASRATAGTLRYDRKAHEARIDALMRLFARGHAVAQGTAGAAPVFVCGMFRSGSTLVEQILASHPKVTAGGEIEVLPAVARQHLDPLLRSGATGLDPERLSALRQLYLTQVRQRFPAAKVLTDKRPDNFLNIGLIKAMFPDARIVHTRRQPMDNALSVYFLHLSRSMPYALDLEDIAHWYGQYRRLMNHWRSLYGADIHDVDYDALVAQPQPAIEALLAHLGLDWHDGCLDFHRTRTFVATPSNWQVRQPLYTHASGRWRRYASHLGALRAALGAYVED
jgi:tetratricopeptide (TPR) repeat protein